MKRLSACNVFPKVVLLQHFRSETLVEYDFIVRHVKEKVIVQTDLKIDLQNITPSYRLIALIHLILSYRHTMQYQVKC